MRQCLLQRGQNQQIAWLPTQYATKGRYLRLHDQNGWKVIQVYSLYQKHVELPHGYLSGGVFHR